MKKIKIKKITLKFCPKCKSVDVEKEMALTMIFGIPQQWKCNKCGFKNYVFPEKEFDN